MTPEPNLGSSWDRVAAELRACREAQQRAWGDIDNTTLGRFLAGEVTPEEQQQIENALDSLPELRKLTDLVREVLAEPETTVPAPAPEVYVPAVLPFPQSRPLAPATPPRESWRPSRASGDHRGWGRSSRLGQRIGLAAAACLLLALGVALPRTNTAATPEAGSSLSIFRPVAERGLPFQSVGRDRTEISLVDEKAPQGKGAPAREENARARVVAAVQALEADGKKQEAEDLARQYANNWTRQARVYQEKGELDRAEPVLNQAWTTYRRIIGPEAPETVRTGKMLAGVYVAALDTPPASPAQDGLDKASFPPSVTTDPSPASGEGRDKRLFATRTRSSPVPGAPPVRSESAYGPPAPPPPMVRSTPPLARSGPKGAYGGYGRRSSPPPVEQQAAACLCERITRQSQRQVKSSVVPVLMQALRETTDAGERQRLARALGRLGPAAGEAVPVLLDACRRSSDPSEKAELLLAIGQVGPVAAARAVPVLVDCLRSDNAEVRENAVRALVLLGPAACQYDREVFKRIHSPEGRSGIDDHAECFSVHALQTGRGEVLRLAKQAHIEIRIETAHEWKALEQKKETIAKDSRQGGVYLYINKDAPAVQVFVSERLQKQGLTAAELLKVVGPHVRQHHFDDGLADGIRYLAEFEKKHARK